MARRRPPVAERVARHVEEHGLVPPEGAVALVSGGPDSTLLAAVLVELGLAARALHVAHALRGPASAADRVHVERLCAGLGVGLRVVDAAVASGPGLEARARAARRAAALAEPAPATLATGHTADDRAETVLYRLAASGGPRSLTALPPRHGRFVRPLLVLERADVRDELRRRGLPWREDASNRDRRHARNRMRRDVLPALARVNARAAANIARAAAIADDERALLERLAAPLVAADGVVDLVALRGVDRALQRVALRLAADRAGLVLGHDDIELLRGLSLGGREERSLPGGTAVRERAALVLVAGAWRGGARPAIVPAEVQVAAAKSARPVVSGP